MSDTVWRHKKTGGLYEEVGRGRIERTYERVVIYRGLLKGGLWVRSEEEFDDGRFEEVPRPSPPNE